ncbi:MAG: DUF2284 domain-containing protein [Firmicutes bacterium]|nr:DUF2284 domain-containing protein [Bacillota bacterium]
MDKNQEKIIKQLKNLAIKNKASYVSLIKVKDVKFSKEFRNICETKVCGAYGTNWMCPPYIGDIHKLIKEAKSFEDGLVIQTITQLEDSFDIEKMLNAGKFINNLARKLKKSHNIKKLGKTLILGSGACGYCEKCSVIKNAPCPFPNMAISSIEAYGIDALSLAKAGSLNYINGQNTVTYYSFILFNQIK